MGYVHIYTGNGKGKSTAAFGLALRHLYAGGRVYIGQFVKSMQYSECAVETDFANIEIEQYGRDCFISRDPEPEDIALARQGLAVISDKLNSGHYSMVIFDEVMIALFYRLFDSAQLIDILKARPRDVEVVLTGRYAPQALIDYADLVTEMREIKHYYQQGVESRAGIDK